MSQAAGARGLETPTPLLPGRGGPQAADVVCWHDVECGNYTADLELWAEIAGASDDPVLDLGCGSGRVALDLARRGHRVVGLDRDPALLATLERRAGGLPITSIQGDARRFDLDQKFGLVLAPMQLIQLFGDAQERLQCLRCAAAHLRPAGRAALAIVEPISGPGEAVALAPDVGEFGGSLYFSFPIETRVNAEAIRLRRLRRLIAAGARPVEEFDQITLRQLSASQLEAEAEAAGLSGLERMEIPATDAHIGSTVLLLGKER